MKVVIGDDTTITVMAIGQEKQAGDIRLSLGCGGKEVASKELTYTEAHLLRDTIASVVAESTYPSTKR